jgi:catechol 2,3-dioxygenase
MEPVRFRPRRLGHANLFVGDLERSITFYNRVCGVEEVRREPGIAAGFLSNGSTHHDLGLMQSSTEVRVGVGGHVQIPHGRGQEPGLNHFGWEMDTEAELVAAYRRATAARCAIHRTSDHQLSHSVYVFDPDGNLHEFYADAVRDWRSIFNTEREDLITRHWDPEAAPPSTESKWHPTPEVRRVRDALFHPARITHAALVARDYSRMKTFFSDVGGLDLVEETADGRAALFSGAVGRTDMVLMAPGDRGEPGLHHIAFEVADERELADAVRNAPNAGIAIERNIDRSDKRSVLIRDPDGWFVEFYAPRGPRVVPELA